MSFIKYEYININEYSRPGIRNNGIDGIVMHYTANNGGTARNHKNYFNNLKGNYASAQLFVDDIEALCIMPLNEVAYHANEISKYNADGSRYRPLYSKIGNANYSTIGVEMCLDRNGNITEKTFQNTVKAVKELIAKYPNITRNKIWRHYDVTGKNCPAPWVAKPSELERFKDAVFGSNGNSSNNNTSSEKPSTPATKPSYITLSVDGKFGPATARRLQQYFGTTQDGVISHQYKQKFNQNIYAAQFDQTLRGSNVIRALQKLLGVSQDGLMGQATIKALQKRLGTTQDGIISSVSNVVKALQQVLNKNKL
ncbi:N-acetylmuramoyl-L-alanine amidase [Enterococcus innesii]|uniref:N-acetylmuramoyl-L-alanine amidase n=1 Tax=Enterococcus innesii TaxID=2839759 RepID=UPI00232D6289|nr:N-acetylmuramoyl-L-alanine amidase [Enterococcus innesii]MDC0752374.1 N-acetylmuramoyl-L-alanine amidase [Enterococcus innesii]MDC0776463.1 N-acetylmuramoyl-L-alanine amidase [Enterococcus innesii]MDC0779631.1 N-acetylmuramoyl-L-alanine amidase [Enterococcus innesii]MDC0783231.1 N-acetylmuramoyl-L-alanine amidase [Enterococcus innesii]